MFRNYLLIAIRTLLKRKLFSFINIFGLAVGMTAFILIVLYLNFEVSYDTFHKNAADIYRVPRKVYLKGELIDHRAANVPAVGPALKANFPEIKDYVRIREARESLAPHVTYQNGKSEAVNFLMHDVFFAGPSFFDIFSYPMVKGDPASTFTTPEQAVITASTADKFFGPQWREATEEGLQYPLGEQLVFYDQQQHRKIPHRIVGIVEDVPVNSHFRFDILLSNHEFTSGSMDNWWEYQHYYTYILTRAGSDPAILQDKILQWKQEQLLKKDRRYTGQGDDIEFPLQPLENIHLESHLMFELSENGDSGRIYFLTVIAILTLVIAWFNYINLSTAKSLERAKEVGLRKTVGAQRRQLIIQFLSEALFINFVAMVIVITILHFSIPFFSALMATPLSFGLWIDGALQVYWFWILLAILYSGSVLLAGLYPAFVLSSFEPVRALKGKTGSANPSGRYGLRKILVIFQFMISAILVAGTLAIREQLTFIQHKNLGFEAAQKLIINSSFFKDSTYQGKLEAFKLEISKYPDIMSVTSSSTIPGIINWDWYYGRVDKQEWDSYAIISVDYDFFDFYGIEFLGGRGFSRDFPSDRKAVVINEAAMELLGYQGVEEALHETIRDNLHERNSYQIVGITKNHHHTSLQNAFDPILFILEGGYFEVGDRNMYQVSWLPRENKYVSIGIRPLKGNRNATELIGQTIDKITGTWVGFFPDRPLDYFFLDHHFDRQYRADYRFGKIFGIFTGLAICISMLGLFGLSSYTILLRTKEIGIRKTLGATVSQILYLLSKDMVRTITVATLFAIPVAYVAIRWWLSNYAFKTAIHWWLLTLPIALILLIVLVTISYQTIRSATANPVQSLKYE